MVFDLDEAMGVSTPTKTKTAKTQIKSSGFDLDAAMKKTPDVRVSKTTTTVSKPQKPVNRKPSLLNPVMDIASGVKQAVPQLPQMALDMGKSAVKNFTPGGALNTAPAIARGALTGIVDLPGSVAGLGVDIVNSIAGKPVINMPEERRRPIGTALEQWRSIQDTTNNLAKNPYSQNFLANHPEFAQQPNQYKPASAIGQYISGNTPGAEKAQFAETMASFLTPMGALGAGVKGSKIAKETARITSKLNAAQKAKYASQVQKLAAKNVANSVKPLTPAQEVWKNTKIGAGLGALEGQGLEERAGNSFGGAALGAGLSAAHIGGKKAWNSAKGQEIRAIAKTGLDVLADQYDSVSQAVAFADSTLKTNLAKKGSLTDKRKQFLDLEARNESLKKNISNKYKSALDESGTLNKREQKKVRNINQYGEDLYNKHTDNGTNEFKENEPVKQNYEFIPENADEPMTGEVKQQPINPPKERLNNSFSQREKNRIIKEAKKTQKETNNFKFPEEDPGDRIHKEVTDYIKKADKEQADRLYQEQQEVETRKRNYEKLKSQTSESNLRRVKEQGNTIYPKEEQTPVKNDSGMSKNTKRNNADKKLKEDLENGNFKPSSIKDKNLESVVRLEPGEAQGANYLYEKTVGKGDIFENVEKDTPSDRTVGMDEAHKNKLKKLTEKYEVIEDPKTNKNIIVNKSTGKPITPKQRKALAKYFDEYKENNREISAEDRVKAEIEESVEDEVYYDKYRDNLSPTEGEGSTGVEKFGAEYKSKNPDFIKWYDNYKKLPEKAKGIELKRKLQEFKNDKKGLEEFYDEFVKQEESDLEATRQKKLGDKYYDTSDIQETEKLSEAAKDIEFEFEKEPVEEAKKGVSASQRKFVDNVWNERIVKGKTRKLYAEGRLNSARDSKTAQKVYDKIVDEIKSLDQSPLVKQVMIEDFNKIADKYLENKKRFGTEIKKLEDFDYKKEVFDNLSNAIEKDDLGKAADIIRNNNLKAKYLSPEETKILNEYYEKRTDKVYKQAEELGFKVVTENGGAEHMVYDHAAALKWCKNKVKSIYKNNPDRLKMELSRLKNENVVKRKVMGEYKKLINTYETILSNDIKFAYDKPQTSLKPIEGAKGTDKQWEQRKTGDVWNPKSSDVMEGIRKANERIRALKSVIPEETDNTRPALGKIGQKLAGEGKVADLKSVGESFKNIKLPNSIKYLFNKYKNQGITFVTKNSLKNKSAYSWKTNELFVEEGLKDNVFVSKVAHELGHKYIHEIIREGGKRAVSFVNDLFGIKLTPEEAVAKLKEEVNNNIIQNKKYRETREILDEKYGKDFVKEAIDEGNKLTEQGKTTRSLISDKRKIYKEYIDSIPDNKIEDFCYDLERRSFDEYGRFRQEQMGEGGWNGRADSEKVSGTEKKVQRKRNEGKQEILESDSKEEKPRGLEKSLTELFESGDVEELERRKSLIEKSNSDLLKDTEFSATSPKIFDFFKKKKIENDKNNPINKIDNGKVSRITDVFKEVSTSRENDFREYGTYPEEQLKNRLYQQSITGEGIYTLQSSKSNGKLDLSREKKQRVGFTYEKTKQGLKHKGTVESDLALNLADQVKRSSARDKVEFLKENFSKKVKGYVPVNSKLLWNAIYFGKSKAWYEIVSKGKKFINEFFDEKSANAFEELYNRVDGGKADIYVPKDIFDLALAGAKELPLDYIKNYGRTNYTLKEIVKTIASGKKRKIKTMTETLGQSARYRMKGMVKLAGATLDFYNDRFKRKVLTSASFVMNNRIGNQIMLMSNADSIGDYINSFKEAKNLKEDSIPREILESTLSESLNNEANNKVRRYFSEENSALETFSQIVDGQYVDLKTVKNLPSKILYGASNLIVSFPNDIFKRISHRLGEINERVERFERKQAASLSLKKMQRENVFKTARSMATVEELAKAAQDNPVLRQTVVDRVNNILGDYNNFNKTERTVLKRIQPFYSWNRTIIRHILNLYKEDPVKATLILYENWRLQHQDDGLEDYQHGSIKLPFKNERTGTNIIMNKTKIIPVNTPFELLGGESLGTITNAIKKPLEAIRGEKFFKPASEITSKKWKRATRNKVKGYYNNKTGEFREGSLPASVRLGYLAKDYTELVYPMMGSPVTKGTVDAVRHKMKTGELLFPDKQYDADFGSYYDGDVIGKTAKGKDRKASVKNKLDFKYQALNKYLGLGIQPERAKEEVKEKKRKFKNKSKRYKSRYKSRHKSRY